jgi:flagellar basal-body rod protein FlgC
MSMMKVFEIAGSGMVAQSRRLNVVASNLANAESAAGPDGKPYRAKQVMFQASPSAELGTRAGGLIAGQSIGHPVGQHDDALGVRVTNIVEDTKPGKTIYDPKHPLADAEGLVTMSNVSVVDEMVNMISASRSYQTNAEVMNTAKNLMLKTLSLGS